MGTEIAWMLVVCSQLHAFNQVIKLKRTLHEVLYMLTIATSAATLPVCTEKGEVKFWVLYAVMGTTALN